MKGRLKKAAVWIGVLVSGLCLNGCEAKIQDFQVTGFALGTVISGTIYTEGEDISQELLQMLEKLEQENLSWKLDDSAVGRINNNGGGTLAKDMGQYLEELLELCRASDGAVDPTLGEIIELWDFDSGEEYIPEKTQIDERLACVDYKNIRLQEKETEWTVSLPDGTALNLGSVGKGIGCDELEKRLMEDGNVTGAVLSLGSSSIMTFGEKPDGSKWQVAIKDPQNPEGEYLGVLQLSGTNYVSTSGNYEKAFVRDGVRYHHILDPKTGYPTESGLASVTVLSDNGMLSDGLSTACFVLGLERGQELLEVYDAEGVFVDAEGNVVLTEGMEKLFTQKSGH